MRATKVAFGVVAAALAVVAFWSADAPAWSFRVDVARSCTASGVHLLVTFANTETNSTQKMNVTVTDQQSSKSSGPVTVMPGHNVTLDIATGLQTVKAGSVVLLASWTNGAQGTDRRTFTYQAFGCDPPPAVPEGLNGIALAVIAAGALSVVVFKRRHAFTGAS
jgi:hypothetical protein